MKSFPLLYDQVTDLPQDDYCPTCERVKLSDSPQTLTILGGAAESDGQGGFGPSESMLGFLDLHWNRDLQDTDDGFLATSVQVAAEVRGGQFSIKVCSLSCLRSLLDALFGEIESRVADEEADYQRWRSETKRS